MDRFAPRKIDTASRKPWFILFAEIMDYRRQDSKLRMTLRGGDQLLKCGRFDHRVIIQQKHKIGCGIKCPTDPELFPPVNPKFFRLRSLALPGRTQ